MDSEIKAAESIIEIIAQSNKPGVTKAQYAVFADRLTGFMRELPAGFHAPLLYHKAWLLAKAEDNAYLDILGQITDDTSLIEAVWLAIQLTAGEPGPESNQKRMYYEAMISGILPVCMWTWLADSRCEQAEKEKLGIIFNVEGPDWPVIPRIDVVKFERIAALFNEMNMVEKAADAYRETVYNFSPPGFYQPGAHETWISAETAGLWITLARLELLAGRDIWAFQALCLAAASDPSRMQELKEMVPVLYKTPEKTTPLYDKEKLLRIAQLYRQCNLHPRAMEVLEIAEKELTINLDTLKNEAAAEWADLIKRYASAREKTCFLFGMKVADYRENPMKLAPHPFLYVN
jgi:hypothetical protein